MSSLAPGDALYLTLRLPSGHGDMDYVTVQLTLPPKEGAWCLLLPQYLTKEANGGHWPEPMERVRDWLCAHGYNEERPVYVTGLHPQWLERTGRAGEYHYGQWVPHDEMQALIALESLGGLG
jgi:hypothetical protein